LPQLAVGVRSALAAQRDVAPPDDHYREPMPTLSEGREAASRRASRPGHRDHYALVVLSGNQMGTIVPIVGDELVIGRGPEAQLYLDEPTLSRLHARVFRKGGHVMVEDLNSTNGTFVGGQRLTHPAELLDGDRIALGGHVLLRFFVQDVVEARATLCLYESSVRDALTGAYNRRYLDERLIAEHSFAERHGLDLAVLMVDIDHFKRVNDEFGHAVGDAVLKVVAESIRRIIRPEDLFARYGGEEFVIVARAVDRRGALILAERVRKRIEHLPMPAHGPAGITVSVGVAVASPEQPYGTPEELVDAADKAMYVAKGEGRNLVRTA
jgi:two-component system cell cycle response regulator